MPDSFAPQPGWAAGTAQPPYPPSGSMPPPAGRPPHRGRGRHVVTMGALVVGLVIGLVIGSSSHSTQSGAPAGTGRPAPGTAGTAAPGGATVTATVTSRVTLPGRPAAQTVAAAGTRPVSAREVGTRDNSSAKSTVLGAGTFTVGQDVPPGRYVITPGSGERGDLSASTNDDPLAIDEVLGVADGLGVPSVTATLTKGEAITISGLAHVQFTPAVTRLRTSMGAGDWTVGLDIAPGRYVARPGHGESGNFVVDDSDGLPVIDEILGDVNIGGVPSVTVSLSDGDEIDISGLATVTFARK